MSSAATPAAARRSPGAAASAATRPAAADPAAARQGATGARSATNSTRTAASAADQIPAATSVRSAGTGSRTAASSADRAPAANSRSATTGTRTAASATGQASADRASAAGARSATNSTRTAASPSDQAPGLAGVARLLADGTRASFCLALLDGRAWTATELARHAGVAASTASEHLNALVAGGLLAEERQGRHRYVRLADQQVAELIESLAAVAPPRPSVPARTLSADSRRRALEHARTCYDHLAGRVGVAIADAMTERDLVDWERGLRLTPAGERWLSDLHIQVPATSKRPALRPCLDWTERRSHLAGAVGAALCEHALDAGWIKRVGSTRAVLVTPAGRAVLAERLGLTDAVLSPAPH